MAVISQCLKEYPEDRKLANVVVKSAKAVILKTEKEVSYANSI